MDEKERESYLKAGQIAERILKNLKIEKGMPFLDLAQSIEKEILSLGAKPAFPVNISCNEIAAHDTPDEKDARTIRDEILKIDFGVHVDGYIADCAFTFDFSEKNEKLLTASRKALEEAISKVKNGTRISDIGKEIERTIKSFGFVPIQNLGGHFVSKYSLHNGEIPNYEIRSSEVLKEGDVIAIEPFATNGLGYVKETNVCRIYSALELKPTRNAMAREFFKKIESEYNKLPFAERWVIKDLNDKIALYELIRNESLKGYPILKERGNGIVSQFETTVIVERDSGTPLVNILDI
jgi:methionyl aminopeptidase